MDLYLQFGHAMRPTCVELIGSWIGGTVILSPRDIQPKSLDKVSKDIQKAGGSVLFDPQFYLPHADHKTLREHSYWPDEYSTDGFFSGSGPTKLVEDLAGLNIELGASAFILPGIYAASIDDAWLEAHRTIAEITSDNSTVSNLAKIATVALSNEALIDDDQIHELLESIKGWPVDGIYLVCEHSQGDYLVKDTNWVINQLDLTAGIRLQKKTVIVGYSNQQSLIFGASAVNAIASGSWMNVRSFPPEKFVIPEEEEIKQKSIWYYCPRVLSEYKITFLDVAHRLGLLEELRAEKIYGSNYADSIFAGPARPSVLGLKERDAFLHYLQCLRVQAMNLRLPTFDATMDAYSRMLDSAEELLGVLHRQGIKGQNRDFKEIIDVNRAALSAHESTRGPMLRHNWEKLK